MILLGLSPRPIAPSHRKYSSQQGGGYLIKSLRRHHSLRKFFLSFIMAWMVRTLLDARFKAIALLAYAGFLRFDELSKLRLKDVIEHSTYFELFIGRSKTDQLHEGAPGHISLSIWHWLNWCYQLPPTAAMASFLVKSKLDLIFSSFALDRIFRIQGVGRFFLRSWPIYN